MIADIQRIYYFFLRKPRFWAHSVNRRMLKKLGIIRKPKRAKREALLELERQIDEQDSVYR